MPLSKKVYFIFYTNINPINFLNKKNYIISSEEKLL